MKETSYNKKKRHNRFECQVLSQLALKICWNRTISKQDDRCGFVIYPCFLEQGLTVILGSLILSGIPWYPFARVHHPTFMRHTLTINYISNLILPKHIFVRKRLYKCFTYKKKSYLNDSTSLLLLCFFFFYFSFFNLWRTYYFLSCNNLIS